MAIYSGNALSSFRHPLQLTSQYQKTRIEPLFFFKNYDANLFTSTEISLPERFNFFSDLYDIAPAFYLKGEEITLFHDPNEFYTELKSQILSAKRRIFLAALYIGPKEKDLVCTLRKALKNSAQLHLYILVDCLRSTRNGKHGSPETTTTLLKPLVQEFPSRVTVSMYHTPDLNGILKKIVPPRLNETIGLMHIKAFGFDDNLILSGANLSHDYFYNRQDRYMLINNTPSLSKYFADLIETIGFLSYNLPLVPTNAKRPSDKFQIPDPVIHSRLFKEHGYFIMKKFLRKWHTITKTTKKSINDEYDTVIFPVIQMPPLSIRQDEKALISILDTISRYGQQKSKEDELFTIILSSGYLNFSQKYKDKFLEIKAKLHLLCASPEANSFFRSKGISKYIPQSYTLIEKQFYEEVCRRKKSHLIKISEYKRPGWTYHAKGLWCYINGESWPSLTMIGSPNYGYRSTNRDLEAEIIVVTTNSSLKKAMHQEAMRLSEHTENVTTETFQKSERKVPCIVRVATWLIKTMF
ncbi:hypothetical protein G9A89_013322 [Geosiphon pyriformis]|nr:hypothetical protein G9A89_013322 [Geosiphon pyriformis]